ncbi:MULTISPECIES: hypothetical protein [unclassified Streptomyces]|uniref:hypothetical protein n=1 Tax=unclassified Streptomyces TaxID=2593676 RepID=UPI0035E18E13
MRTAIHCETWAGTPDDPHRWLLARDIAPTPSGAVRRLINAAERLADRLDDDPDDGRPFPAATLRLWTDDRLGHEDITARLATGAYVSEAVTMTGPGSVRYTLTAMPAAGCVCLPRSLATAARRLEEARA